MWQLRCVVTQCAVLSPRLCNYHKDASHSFLHRRKEMRMCSQSPAHSFLNTVWKWSAEFADRDDTHLHAWLYVQTSPPCRAWQTCEASSMHSQSVFDGMHSPRDNLYTTGCILLSLIFAFLWLIFLNISNACTGFSALTTSLAARPCINLCCCEDSACAVDPICDLIGSLSKQLTSVSKMAVAHFLAGFFSSLAILSSIFCGRKVHACCNAWRLVIVMAPWGNVFQGVAVTRLWQIGIL